MQAQISLLMDQYDIELPQLPDFDFSSVQVEWERLKSNIPEVWKFHNDGREFMVGEQMREKGLSAEYPVVLVPGVISTVRRLIYSFTCDVADSVSEGFGVLVNVPGLSDIFPRETMGRV
jgi:hypothetical protein